MAVDTVPILTSTYNILKAGMFRGDAHNDPALAYTSPGDEGLQAPPRGKAEAQEPHGEASLLSWFNPLAYVGGQANPEPAGQPAAWFPSPFG